MKPISLFSGILLCAAASGGALAWDPVGDLMNPGRIVRNVERETRNAGREVDRMRIEAQANAAAPAFEAWLRQSRNNASNGAMPVPPHIVEQLRGHVRDDILASARYKIGDPGVFNLANLSIRYGGAAAVALIDVIVFTNPNDAHNNDRLWVHELKHIQQFKDWGVRDFAIRYLRSWNGVENEANEATNNYVATRGSRFGYPPSAQQFGSQPSFTQLTNPQPSFSPQFASACMTPVGMCPMPGGPMGMQCYCMTMGGPIYGISR